MNRRQMLATTVLGGASLAVAGCSSEDLAAAKAKLQAMRDWLLAKLKAASTKAVAGVTALASYIPLAVMDSLIQRVKANDVEIQQATKLLPVLRVYAGATLDAVKDVIKLARNIPAAGPYIAVLDEAISLIDAFIQHPETVVA